MSDRFEMRTPEREPRISATVTLIGCTGVGKTALVVRYLTKRYIGDYISGADMIYKCKLHFMRKRIRVEILDTSGDTGKDHIKEIVRFRQSENDVIILVYSVDDDKSFRYVSDLLPEIADISPRASIFMIGNKSDLIDRSCNTSFENDIKRLSARHEFSHMVVSAKSSCADATLIFSKSISAMIENTFCESRSSGDDTIMEEEISDIQRPAPPRRFRGGRRDYRLARRATFSDAHQEPKTPGLKRNSSLNFSVGRENGSHKQSNGEGSNPPLSSFSFRRRSGKKTPPCAIRIEPVEEEQETKFGNPDLPEMPRSAPLPSSKVPVFQFPVHYKKDPWLELENARFRSSNSLPNTPSNMLSPLRRNNSFLNKLKGAFNSVPGRLRSPK